MNGLRAGCCAALLCMTGVVHAAGERIVALAPHAAELVHAAGAGHLLVGVVRYSDQPPAVRDLPVIGDAARLDFERIVALEPTLAVAWPSGNRAADLERLAALGIGIFNSDPAHIDDIPHELIALGERLDTAGVARGRAADFSARLAVLRARHAGHETLRVAHALWFAPLLVSGGAGIQDEAMRVCGGVNVFGERPARVVQVDAERVVARAPDLLIITNEIGVPESPWLAWLDMRGLRHVSIDADLWHRPGPRFIEAVERLCAVRAPAS